MNSIDLTPLYRSSVGFDHLASLLNATLGGGNSTSAGYPPYNIEALDDERYAITLAVAGFTHDELDIQVEKGVLTVRGQKPDTEDTHRYLYQGIANRAFERRFNLAEFVEVTGASLVNGLLTINLVKEIPEAMKPRRIVIKSEGPGELLEHDKSDQQAA